MDSSTEEDFPNAVAETRGDNSGIMNSSKLNVVNRMDFEEENEAHNVNKQQPILAESTHVFKRPPGRPPKKRPTVVSQEELAETIILPPLKPLESSTKLYYNEGETQKFPPVISQTPGLHLISNMNNASNEFALPKIPKKTVTSRNLSPPCTSKEAQQRLKKLMKSQPAQIASTGLSVNAIDAEELKTNRKSSHRKSKVQRRAITNRINNTKRITKNIVRRPAGRPPTGRRVGRPKARATNKFAAKDLGRWKPSDDLALTISVLQTNDLRVVHKGIKFSCRFTLDELTARWTDLLYHKKISGTAVQAIHNLHPEIVRSIKTKALFSDREEEILCQFKSTDNPSLEQFEDLLQENCTSFYCARTGKSLMKHWHLMKKYFLLPDQIIQPEDDCMSLSDFETQIDDMELITEEPNETLESELILLDQKHKHNIRLLEEQISRLTLLGHADFDAQPSTQLDIQTLAVLRGRQVRYLMRSGEITFGRAAGANVDIDLSLEGPAYKISRHQGTIKLRSNGDFLITNLGKRAIFVNGKPLLTGSMGKLVHNSMLEICDLRFVFLVNHEILNLIRTETALTKTVLN